MYYNECFIRFIFIIFTGQSLVVKVNLNEESFTPGKKNYNRVQKSLKEALRNTFDVLISWDPPEEKICPSSVAAWFNDRGYDVSVCQQQYNHKTANNIQFPTLDQFSNDTIADPERSLLNFFDWYGYFSTDCDLFNNEIEVLSSWKKVLKSRRGQVQYIQYKGFFTSDKLIKIINSIQEYVLTKKELPWCCIDIHGFIDSPINWDLHMNMFYIAASDNITILLHPKSNEMTIRLIEPTVNTKTKKKIKKFMH